ncbi:hypothetical protein FNV43_RR16982 [Rhamnella rubrinervis]|uniref:Uncharacterized protein n=1 Tax=Rhamnella rubrinervis TaxID=2594499 RepID=A0A8K0ME60_9ROSA|nr:hypothetical protein FNV43_RR16982 [Rhamnella rubrinervis]
MGQLVSSLLCGLRKRRGALIEELAMAIQLVAQGLEVPPIVTMDPEKDEDSKEDEDLEKDLEEDSEEFKDFLVSKDSQSLQI